MLCSRGKHARVLTLAPKSHGRFSASAFTAAGLSEDEAPDYTAAPRP